MIDAPLRLPHSENHPMPSNPAQSHSHEPRHPASGATVVRKASGSCHPRRYSGLLLSPMFASAAMAASSVSVIADALRLRRVRL